MRRPDAVGENETDTAQLALGARLEQVLVWIGKSAVFAPVSVTAETINVVSPTLVRVTVWGMDVVPWFRAANESEVADKETLATPPIPEALRYTWV